MSDINSVTRREMVKAVTAILETKLSPDGDDEKRRQDRMAKAAQARGIVSDGEKKVKEQDEAEEESKTKDKDEKREDRTGGKGTADSQKVKTPKEKVLKSPTIGSIVDKLNALRGGKSLKDKDVKESFEQYFEGLDKTERQALLAFLTGIAQILTGVEKGSDALEPRDLGIKSKESNRNTAQEQTPEKETGAESSPIVVGEKKDYDIQRALNVYRKNNA